MTDQKPKRQMPRGVPRRHRAGERADKLRPTGDRPTEAATIFTGRPLKEQGRKEDDRATR